MNWGFIVMTAGIHCDVLITGGGVAGVLAAAAAASSGARAVLVERRLFIGGTAVAGLLNNICGLYLNGGDLPAGTLNSGMTANVVSLLNKLAPERRIRRLGRVFVLPFRPDDLKTVLQSLCSNETKLTVLTGTEVTAVEKKNGRITTVVTLNNGALRRINPSVVIDCSGNGGTSVLAGVPFDISPPEEIQMSGYTAFVKGIKKPEESMPLKIPYYLADAAAAGRLPPHLRFTVFSAGDHPDEGFLKFSIAGGISDKEAKTDALDALGYLAQRIPALKDAYIHKTSQGVMEREGRRIKGLYTLTQDDVLNAVKFSDGVVKNSWPIELWDRKRGPVYRYVPSGDYYEIPFRCMQVEDFSNLLCAGRCISVSHEALGSTRVMGVCMAMGEQAGYAAARYAAQGSFNSNGIRS
jgi:hypothetical protein